MLENDTTDRREGERRVGDRRQGERRAEARPGRDRRRGPRRVRDRRGEPWMRLLLVTLLAMLSLMAPPFSQADEAENVCFSAPVSLDFYGRAREAADMSLTHCDGTPNEAALFEFSSLLRPRGAAEASADAPRETSLAEGFIAPGIRRFDPQLMLRLQALADHWPDRRITVVSGYRSRARSTSRHFAGRALDVRVQGVHRAEVAAFARTLPGTGVGFYPASTFTHIDVRQNESFWVDQSAPGQRSRYAAQVEEDGILAAMLTEIRAEVVADSEPPTEPPTTPAVSPQGLLAEALAQVRDDLTPLERTVLRRPSAPSLLQQQALAALATSTTSTSISATSASATSASESPTSNVPATQPAPAPAPPVSPQTSPTPSPASATTPAVVPSTPPTSASTTTSQPTPPPSTNTVDWTIPWKGE